MDDRPSSSHRRGHAAETGHARKTPVTARVSADRATILIVDDDETTRQTFQLMLVEEGYNVLSAATPEEGLAQASSDPPDAVLLDLHMPLINGLEWLRLLRDAPGERVVPVAIVTGDYFLDEEMARELKTLGARIYFKPLWDSDLKRLVHELLGTL